MPSRSEVERRYRLQVLDRIARDCPAVATMPFMDVVAAFPEMKTLRYVGSYDLRMAFRRPHGHCGWCGREVAPPRVSWCGDECVNAFRAINDRAYQRGLVRERDKNICFDCKQFSAKWEMDHVIPVVLGGGLCTIDNLRTLCLSCHKKHTAALNGRLTSLKKEARNG